ncbi:MAG: FKBP-type peptidyl-prolyl cis-trans isomerase [Sulfurimonas sp.]|nr:FKBP-type peptidyl-prolyl cis-trans isomerase [Sulfurimonas sp.]
MEVLFKMRVGDKWQVFIPTELSRALHAIATRVPQNSTLVFDIELLEISK